MKMRTKIILNVIFGLLLMGLISQKLIFFTPAKAVETAMIYVDPPMAYALPGQNFTINLNVGNVTGLNTWEVKLRFDPEFLDIDSTMIKEGPFLQSVGDTIFLAERHPYYIWFGCVLIPLDTVNGSGTLAYITFHVVKKGDSLLHLYETYLRTPDLNDILHTTKDGYFFMPQPLRVYNIDTGLNYTNIQEAINAPETLNGHTILAGAGTYYENVVVNKGVSLLGESRETTIIDGNGTGTVAEVTVDNVTVKDFTIRNSGGWPESGIRLSEVKNCNVSGNNIANNYFGIRIDYSSNNSITGNVVTANSERGIWLRSFSTNNSITGNIITANWYGISLEYSSNNVLRDNVMAGNERNFGVYGHEILSHFINDVDDSNMVDGKPVVYLVNKQNLTIDPQTHPNIGYLAIVNSTNITVQHLNMKNNGEGILFAYTNSSSIHNVTAISNYNGVRLVSSSNNSIFGNNLTANNGHGVSLRLSSNNSVTRNTIANNGYGITLESSLNNSMSRNNITANDGHGVLLSFSSNNSIFHNNFVENQPQAKVYESYGNLWDDGYPSGGNYWSDYVGVGVDQYSGPDQNGTGSDGIGDSPYTLDANNRDGYPLMGAFVVRSVGWETKTYPISLFSNSTVSEINFDQPGKKVCFNVTGLTGTNGFCRVAIPKTFMWCDPGHPEQWNVTVDGSPPTYLKVLEDVDYTYLYFVYSQSTRDAIVTSEYVVPEFSTWASLFLVFAVVSVIIVFYKRKLLLHDQP